VVEADHLPVVDLLAQVVVDEGGVVLLLDRQLLLELALLLGGEALPHHPQPLREIPVLLLDCVVNLGVDLEHQVMQVRDIAV
jgi:hypothetical protein